MIVPLLFPIVLPHALSHALDGLDARASVKGWHQLLTLKAFWPPFPGDLFEPTTVFGGCFLSLFVVNLLMITMQRATLPVT